MLDKDSLKFNLTIEDVSDFLSELNAEPIQKDSNTLVCKTICHHPQNDLGEASHKLYYYDNTHLFRCFTQCEEEAFDIYELTSKVKSMEGFGEWSLPKAVFYVAAFFGHSSHDFNFGEEVEKLSDWQFFKNYEKVIKGEERRSEIQLPLFDDTILKNLPFVRIPEWEQEGISPQVMKDRGIKYDPVNQAIVIPHYGVSGELIGIRERTLIKENEKYGKYIPAIIAGKQYNHPLSFALYNLNNSKENIKIMKKVLIFESEKATLQYASMFGQENDISVAVCGSSLISHQVQLLRELGVEELIIGFDKQFQQINDDEFKRWTKKLINIHKKYSPYLTISFLFDKENNLLGYKDSPTDKGKEIFLKLFERRIYLK